MCRNNSYPDKPKCKDGWRFNVEIAVGLIAPFLPDIFDYLMKLFQF